MSDKFADLQRAIWKSGTLVYVGYEGEEYPGIVLGFSGESLGYIDVIVDGVVECIVNPMWNQPVSSLPGIGDNGAVFMPIHLQRDNPYYDTVANATGLRLRSLMD